MERVIQIVVLKMSQTSARIICEWSRGVECQVKMSHIDTCGARVNTSVAILIEIDWQQVKLHNCTEQEIEQICPPVTHQW